MQKVLSYVGDFDGALDEPATVIFSVGDSEYILEGIFRKPGFKDTNVIYFLQESDSPQALLTPIDENATVYRGPGKKEMTGVVIMQEGARKVTF